MARMYDSNHIQSCRLYCLLTENRIYLIPVCRYLHVNVFGVFWSLQNPSCDGEKQRKQARTEKKKTTDEWGRGEVWQIMLARLGSAPVVVWWIMDFLHVGWGKWPRMSFSWLSKHACSFQAFPVCTRDFVCECVCLCMYVCVYYSLGKTHPQMWAKTDKPSFKGIQVCHQLKDSKEKQILFCIW